MLLLGNVTRLFGCPACSLVTMPTELLSSGYFLDLSVALQWGACVLRIGKNLIQISVQTPTILAEYLDGCSVPPDTFKATTPDKSTTIYFLIIPNLLFIEKVKLSLCMPLGYIEGGGGDLWPFFLNVGAKWK